MSELPPETAPSGAVDPTDEAAVSAAVEAALTALHNVLEPTFGFDAACGCFAYTGAVRDVAALPDPVGEITERWTRPNGLKIEKMRRKAMTT